MAASSMSKLHHGPVDIWSIRERLALACSVMKSGDQNWVSVSRAIKPYMEANRPSHWFSQKNCAMQYSDLLEKVETPKRKRGDGGHSGEVDTPADQIFRKLMTERIEELRTIVLEEQQRYKKLKRDIECMKSGQYDDRLPQVWRDIQAGKAEEETSKEADKKSVDDVRGLANAQQAKLGIKCSSITSQGSTSEQEETQEAFPEFPILDVGKTDEEVSAATGLPSLNVTQPGTGLPTLNVASQPDQRSKTVPPTSPLLSSLLQSKLKSADSLQQLKNEAEQADALTQQQVQQLALQLQQSAESAVTQAREAAAREAAVTVSSAELTGPDDQTEQQLVAVVTGAHTELLSTSPSCAAPTLSKLLFTPAQAKHLVDTSLVTSTPLITVTEDPAQADTKPADLGELDSADESITVDVTAVEVSSPERDMPDDQSCDMPDDQSCDVSCDTAEGKEEAVDDDEFTMTRIKSEYKGGGKQVSISQMADDEDSSEVAGSSFLSVDEEVSIKEEPASPASSVSSKVSEAGGKTFRSLRRKGRGSRSSSSRRTRPRRSVQDDTSSKHSDVDLSDYDMRESDDLVPTAGSVFSESIPNSPASLSMCSDTEEEKVFKTWKKSIMLVWRSAANHKYANVFLHPVTNEIAPGYKAVVHRPMDLGTIKKNIESGLLRTTTEFQRDLMLMFTNAIMYNSSDQPVFKMATEMYNDVMHHIEQYVSTQLMVQSSETKVLRQSRRSELQEKDEEAKKRRTSSEQPSEGGKTKRRKTRADDI